MEMYIIYNACKDLLYCFQLFSSGKQGRVVILAWPLGRLAPLSQVAS